MQKQIMRLSVLFTAAVLLFGGFTDIYARRLTAEKHSEQGNEYLEKEDYDKAIKSFNRAVKLEPGNAYYRFELGDAYERKGNYRKAVKSYSEAILIDPEDPAYYTIRGYAYHFRKKYALAAADLTRAIELDPSEPSVYHSRGRIYLFQRDYDKAITDFTAAIRLDPKNANYLTSRGDAYVKKGIYDKAMQDFSAAVAIDPNHVYAIDELAKAERALQKRDARLIAHGNAASKRSVKTASLAADKGDMTGKTSADAQEGDSVSAARAERRAAAREKLVQVSANYLGTPYKWGGMSISGMDCSGFTSIVFKETYNLSLPRTSEGMWTWDKGREVTVEEARAGDLVFFNNSKAKNKAVDHVGIYLGDNKFIHASSSRGVAYNNLTENYYSNNFVGIRRVPKRQGQSN